MNTINLTFPEAHRVSRTEIGGRVVLWRPVRPTPPPDNGTGRWTFCVDSTNKKSVNKWDFCEVSPDGARFADRGREKALMSRVRCPFGNEGNIACREPFSRRIAEENPNGALLYRASAEGSTLRHWDRAASLPDENIRLQLEGEISIKRVQDVPLKDVLPRDFPDAFAVFALASFITFVGYDVWDRNDWGWLFIGQRVARSPRLTE